MKVQEYIRVDALTRFETKRSGGNDEQNKLDEARIKRVYVGNKCYDSSCLFIPWGSKVPAKSIEKDSGFSD